jgi:hypothetical protein
MFSFVRVWLLRTIFWDVGQVFKKFKIRPLESSQMGHTVFKENKILHAHILEVRPA